MLGLSLADVVYGLGLCAVACAASAAVLEAGRNRFDLFGMIVVAMTGALGGGSVRDMMLNRPVFWILDQSYLLVCIAAALVTFYLARRISLPAKIFLLPDAVGLALFTVIGTRVSLAYEVPWLAATFMGVVTGVMGGMLRDVLCNEVPLIFQGTLYATAAWAGALIYVGLLHLGWTGGIPETCAGTFILLLRLAAMRWSLSLPVFRSRISLE